MTFRVLRTFPFAMASSIRELGERRNPRKGCGHEGPTSFPADMESSELSVGAVSECYPYRAQRNIGRNRQGMKKTKSAFMCIAVIVLSALLSATYLATTRHHGISMASSSSATRLDSSTEPSDAHTEALLANLMPQHQARTGVQAHEPPHQSELILMRSRLEGACGHMCVPVGSACYICV